MSIYTKSTLGVADNLLTFNDTTTDPYFRVNARAPQRYQLQQQDAQVTFESGISDFNTLIGETVYIIQGTMYPRSQATYDSGLARLRTVASLDFEQGDASTDFGYVPYKWGDASGDLAKQIFVKPLYVMFAETTQQGYVVPFKVYCKIKDPTIFSGSSKTATTQTANFSQTTGAAVFSVAFPVVFGSTLFSVSATATNSGTISGYPASIIVHGPVNVPKITNGATGESISVNVNMTSVNDVLTIIYDKDTFTISLNGTSKIQYLTTDSTLFKLKPGGNVLSLTGTSVSTSAYAVCNYYDYYPLS